jgi:hypothetical protein
VRRVRSWPAGTVAGLLLVTGAGAAAQSGDASSDPGEAPAATPGADTSGAEAAPPEPSAADATPAETGAGLFEQSIAATSSGASTVAPVEWSGYIRGDFYQGKTRGAADSDVKAAYTEFSLIARTTKGTYGDAYAETRLRYGRQGDVQDTFLDVREAYANAYLGPVDLRLGKQIIVWGRADLLNPTNNLTPNDMRIRSPIEDDRRIGNVGARAIVRLQPLPMRFEAVWMPFFVPSELPPVSLPSFVSFADPVYPEPAARNGLGAGRLHLELPSVEMSISYLQGPAPLPGLTLTSVTYGLDPSVKVSRTAYRHQVIGFDFSTAIGDIVAIRGEAAYRRPFEYQDRIYNPRPDLQYALGLDRTFGKVMVIVQYLGRYAFDWSKKEGLAGEVNADELKLTTQQEIDAYDAKAKERINIQLEKINQILFNQTERLQHLATARVEWMGLNDALSISAIGMFNVTTKEWLAAPKIGFRFSDSLIGYLGAEILTGPKDTLFSLVDETLSAGYVELRSTF